MQHEGELRSDMDYLIEILRSNPKTKFTLSKLQTLTGFPSTFLKKWINVLEEQGHIRFFYNISDEEFTWVSNNSDKQVYNDKEIANYVHKQTHKVSRKTYTKKETTQLLGDIKVFMQETKTISARIEKLKKSRNVDLAAVQIAKHNLAQKKEELSHLLEQIKKIRD